MTAEDAKQMRRQLGLTIADLSRMTGIPTRTIQSYELGERGVPKDYPEKLSRVRAGLDGGMRRAIASVEQSIARLYPNGIPSAPVIIDEENEG